MGKKHSRNFVAAGHSEDSLGRPTGYRFRDPKPNEALKLFIETVGENEKERRSDQWSYESGGETVFVRDRMDSLLGTLNRYANIGDIAVGSKPDIAALAWAGFRLLLQVGLGEMN